jgi:hypothetical protein
MYLLTIINNARAAPPIGTFSQPIHSRNRGSKRRENNELLADVLPPLKQAEPSP